MCEDNQLPDRKGGAGGGDVVPFRRPGNGSRMNLNRNAELLRHVTAALGIPADHFHTAPGTNPQTADAAMQRGERDALLRAFDSIQDPIVRRHLVKLVRALSGVADSSSEPRA